MKLIIVLAACFGVTFTTPTNNKFVTTNLGEDLQDFVDLVPLEDLKNIFEQHLETDGALSLVVTYLQNKNWDGLEYAFLLLPDVQNFISWLEDGDIPVSNILATVYRYIHSIVPGVAPDQNGSLRPFLDEVEAALPIDGLAALLNDKLQNDQDFQDLYSKISSEQARALIEEIRAVNEVQRIAQVLRGLDVRVDDFFVIIYDFLGWGRPKFTKIVPLSLASDLQEFVDLLPLDDIGTIIGNHLQTDGALAAVIEYLQSPGWTSLEDSLLEQPAPSDVFYWLIDHDVPINVIRYIVRKVIERTFPAVDPDENGSLRPFLDEIEAVLPIDEMATLLNDKLQNSSEFQAFYAEISSEEMYAWVRAVRSILQIRNIEESLRNMGVKVDEALAAIYQFLGWEEAKTL